MEKKRLAFCVHSAKIKIMPPLPESSFEKNLKYHVVMYIKYNEYGSISAGHKIRPVTTRISDHQQNDYLWVKKLAEYPGFTSSIEWKIFDGCRMLEKCMTIEATFSASWNKTKESGQLSGAHAELLLQKTFLTFFMSEKNCPLHGKEKFAKQPLERGLWWRQISKKNYIIKTWQKDKKIL